MFSIYIFVPLYIEILGETSYGLVSFFATLQTAFNILGLGLANTLRREMAVGEKTVENNIKKYKLLRSIEIIYVVIAILICLICILFSGQIATEWLIIDTLDSVLVARVISLMGISIAIQLIANLHLGVLFGLDYQVIANSACIVWSAVKSIGSLLLIRYIKPDLLMFYGWHILSDALYLLFLRYHGIHKLNLQKKERIWKLKDIKQIKRVWKYASGILFISFIALVNKQLDKVVISNNLPLAELGAYNVAITLGSLTTFIPLALYVSVFPLFTQYATTGEMEKLKRLFSDINKPVNIILSCMIAYIAAFSDNLIMVWTGSSEYVRILGVTGALAVVAVGLVEYQELPYALALAHGQTKYNALVGGIFIPITFVATYYGITNYGLIGAGCVYMGSMLIQTLLYTYIVYKKYVYKHPLLHVATEIVIPLVCAMLVAVTCKKVIGNCITNEWMILFAAILMGIVTMGIELVLFSRKECAIVLEKINKKEKRQ